MCIGDLECLTKDGDWEYGNVHWRLGIGNSALGWVNGELEQDWGN